MTHFAKLDENNMVIFITVGRQEDDGKEQELFERTGDIYKQTSYNTHGGIYYDPETSNASEDQSKALRKNYARLGWYYNEERDAFIPPQPYESWWLDEESCLWYPPVDRPLDDNYYQWDEDSTSWILVEDQ